MPSSDNCPGCSSDRLAVMYYDAKGQPLGGHSLCTECGPRSAQPVIHPADSPARKKLLEKKAS